MNLKSCLLPLATLAVSIPLTAVSAQQEQTFPQLNYDKFAVKLSKKVCDSYQRPKTLRIPFARENPQTPGEQNVFYFALNEFRKDRPTMLFAPGGPGGLPGPKFTKPELVEDYNVISYHPRGAGCSAEPLDIRGDRGISPLAESRDIEAIREDLGIERWDVIYGKSAGTNTARIYATNFPNRVGKLILMGVAAPTLPEEDLQKRKRSETLWADFVRSERHGILGRLSSEQIKRLGEKFVEHLADEKGIQNFFVSSIMQDGYADPAVKNESRDIILAMMPMVMRYTGNLPGLNDELITEYVRQWAGYNIDYAGDVKKLQATMKMYRNTFFSALPIDEFPPGEIKVGARVLFLLKSDLPLEETCHPVPTLILQGSEDMSTPMKNAFTMGLLPQCYRGTTSILLEINGGHSLELEKNCHKDLFRAFISSPDGKFDYPESCKKEKSLRFNQR